MSYVSWLLATCAASVLLERLVPWRENQPLWRAGWLRNARFVALNGHFFSLLTAGLTGAVAAGTTGVIQSLGVRLPSSPVVEWPFALQFVAFLVLADVLQWCIHNLLHRMPWLWTFHKVRTRPKAGHHADSKVRA